MDIERVIIIARDLIGHIRAHIDGWISGQTFEHMIAKGRRMRLIEQDTRMPGTHLAPENLGETVNRHKPHRLRLIKLCLHMECNTRMKRIEDRGNPALALLIIKVAITGNFGVFRYQRDAALNMGRPVEINQKTRIGAKEGRRIQGMRQRPGQLCSVQVPSDMARKIGIRQTQPGIGFGYKI